MDHEDLCKRCGACCGVTEENPCGHLKQGLDKKYFCDIYENGLGLEKLLKAS